MNERTVKVSQLLLSFTEKWTTCWQVEKRSLQHMTTKRQRSAGVRRGGQREGLTKNGEQTDEYRCKSAHAKLECLALLDELTVLAPEPVQADATVAQARVLVDTTAAVTTGTVQALVLVSAPLAVGRHYAALATAGQQEGLCQWEDGVSGEQGGHRILVFILFKHMI